MLAKTFSANLKRTRVRRQLSQEALARTAKISVSYVSMLERELRSPPLETIELLAAALQVRPLDLLRA
jgi:transcriptional regulator with XRE-family HTH domain